MLGQAGPKREQRVSLSLLRSFSKSPDVSRSPMWKVNVRVRERQRLQLLLRSRSYYLMRQALGGGDNKSVVIP